MDNNGGMGNGMSGMRGSKHGTGNLGGVHSEIEAGLTPDVLGVEIAILDKLGVLGGPTNPDEWFSENVLGSGGVDENDKLFELV